MFFDHNHNGEPKSTANRSPVRVEANHTYDEDGIPKVIQQNGSDYPVTTPDSIDSINSIRGFVQAFNTHETPTKDAITNIIQTRFKDLKPQAFNGIEQSVSTLMDLLKILDAKIESEMEALKKQGNGAMLTNGFVALEAKKKSVDLTLFLIITKLVRAYEHHKKNHSVDVEAFGIVIADKAPKLLETLKALRKTRADISNEEKKALEGLEEIIKTVPMQKPFRGSSASL